MLPAAPEGVVVAAVAAAHAAPDLAMVVAGGALRQQSLAKTPTPASQVVVCARTTRQQSRGFGNGARGCNIFSYWPTHSPPFRSLALLQLLGRSLSVAPAVTGW